MAWPARPAAIFSAALVNGPLSEKPAIVRTLGSEPHCAFDQLRMNGAIERAVSAGFGIPHVERVGHDGGVEPVLHQLLLLLLERLGARQRRAQAQEQRMRI